MNYLSLQKTDNMNTVENSLDKKVSSHEVYTIDNPSDKDIVKQILKSNV